MIEETNEVKFWQEAGEVIAFIPIKLKRRNGVRKIIMPDDAKSESTALVEAIAKAHHWQKLLEDGHYATMTDIGQANGFSRVYVGKILSLVNLSPKITKLILDGDEPDGLSLQILHKGIPQSWSDQHAIWLGNV